MQPVGAARRMREIEMETQGEHLAPEVCFIRRRRVRIRTKCRIDDASGRVPWLEHQVAITHPVPLRKVVGHTVSNFGYVAALERLQRLLPREQPGSEQT